MEKLSIIKKQLVEEYAREQGGIMQQRVNRGWHMNGEELSTVGRSWLNEAVYGEYLPEEKTTILSRISE